jgi:hypothetical protein
MPAVTSSSIIGNYIALTGTNLITDSDFVGKVKYAGVYADTVTINSDTDATATFTKGVPFDGVGSKPEVSFVSSSATHFASVSTTLQNMPPTTLTVADVECSFAGGCLYSIDSDGLASTLSNSTRAQISVCGQTCEYAAYQSTDSTAKCYLPSLSTKYSVENFSIQQKSTIQGTLITDDPISGPLIFDGNNVAGYNKTTTNCYFGISVAEGYVGVLSEVKIFMNRFSMATYAGNLVF